MRCPNCGAENVDRAIYCGSCAAQLREFEAVDRDDEIMPSIPRQLAPIVSGTYVKWFIGAAVLGAVLSAVGLLSGDHDSSVMLDTLQILAAPLFLIFWFVMRRKMRNADYIVSLTRYISQGPPFKQTGVRTSARSIPLTAVGGLGFAAAMGVMFIAVGVYVEPRAVNAAWTIAIGIGAAFLAMTAFAATRVTNELWLSWEGIQIHNSRMNFTIHFARDNIAEAGIRGRVLRVVLKQVPFGMARRSRHIIRGDVRERAELSQAMERYGLGQQTRAD